jgi:hypothetical protein
MKSVSGTDRRHGLAQNQGALDPPLLFAEELPYKFLIIIW